MRSIRGINRRRISTFNKENINEKSLEMLKNIFENINRWLNFAEAKNGALLGINSMLLFKAVDYFFEDINCELKINNILVVLMIICFIVGLFIVLISFFPNTGVYKDKPSIPDEDTPNNDRLLIFYEDIKKYPSPEKYLQDIYKHYFGVHVELKGLKRVELDYAVEILSNSKIASYKYKLFKYALILNFIGLLIFIILLKCA